jgi:large-conductance mechanosensitive channel MscL
MARELRAMRRGLPQDERRSSVPSIDSGKQLGSRVAGGAAHELGGFKKLILRGNVVDLAIGVVIGAVIADEAAKALSDRLRGRDH